MGYYYHDNDDEFNNSHRAFSMPVIVTTAVVSGIILVILRIVLATNNTTSGKNNLKNTQMKNKMNEEDIGVTAYDEADMNRDDYEKLYREGKLRADDLDIWDMYDGRSTREEPVPRTTDSDAGADTENEEDDEASSDAAEPTGTPSSSPSPTPDENALLEDVKENPLDFKNIQIVDNKMAYYQNGENVSKLGVMISQDNGVVDFKMLKDNGIDFVMIKVGQRGYDSGVIKPDENYERNIKAADEAGMPMGLYFSSRAVTTLEAGEEAQFCTSAAYDYSVKYPIAFLYEGELIDDARTDILEKEDKSKIAEAFMKQVSFDGYVPILYGTEDYLLNQIEPAEILKNSDVMLNEQSLLPTYPYQFKMWRYITNQTIPGVEKGGDYVISFVDYAGR